MTVSHKEPLDGALLQPAMSLTDRLKSETLSTLQIS